MKYYLPLLLSLSGAANICLGAEIETYSTLEWNSAYAVKNNDWSKHAFDFRPSVVTHFDSGSKLTFNGLLRWDAADEIEPGQPEQPFRDEGTKKLFISDEVDVEFREFFLESYWNDTYLKIGKQQIVWGQADGLQVLDVINPLSFYEFILPDREYSRIPVWSAVAEIPISEWELQLLWVPDTTVTESTAPGSSFSLLNAFNDINDIHVDLPDPIKDSDYGIKASSYINGWDISFNYLYHFINNPVIFFEPNRQQTIAQYNRSHLIGATSSTVFGNTIFRSEIGLETNKRYRNNTFDGFIEMRELAYVLGLDYDGIENTFISGQFLQTIRSEELSYKEKTSEQITLLLQRKYFNEQLLLEGFVIHDIENSDSLVQLMAEYQWKTNILLNIGADYFFGPTTGDFGQYKTENRIYLGSTFSF